MLRERLRWFALFAVFAVLGDIAAHYLGVAERARAMDDILVWAFCLSACGVGALLSVYFGVVKPKW